MVGTPALTAICLAEALADRADQNKAGAWAQKRRAFSSQGGVEIIVRAPAAPSYNSQISAASVAATGMRISKPWPCKLTM
jgi:hypothetical protein